VDDRPDVDRQVRQQAIALGFDVVAVARADEPLGVEHERYRAFIEAGMHGAMGYLAQHAEARRRLNGPEILEGARSVVCVGRRYARSSADEANDPPLARTIARYARGQDYHGHLRKKLQKLAAFIRGLGPGIEARALCDIEPVMERVWAMRSGLGFVGKHGLVITPGQGSYLLLGEVVTTLALVPDVPMHERCGSCTRCLDACPTNAFVKPFVLDPRKCIAYLTIEQHDPPAEELREGIGEHLFGCDVCQEACPYNRTAPPPAERTKQFHPLSRWEEMDLPDLVALDEESFPEATTGTPLRRARRDGLARNAVIVASNRLARDPEGPSAARDRATLDSASTHDDPSVREMAAWGRARALAGPEAREEAENEAENREKGGPVAPRS
jgi:epoxyqueuosine reductase